MRRHGKRTCNYCRQALRRADAPRFVSGSLSRYEAYSQVDLGHDFSVTWKTRKGKIMDFCDYSCQHRNRYGKKVPVDHPDPERRHAEILAKRGCGRRPPLTRWEYLKALLFG